MVEYWRLICGTPTGRLGPPKAPPFSKTRQLVKELVGVGGPTANGAAEKRADAGAPSAYLNGPNRETPRKISEMSGHAKRRIYAVNLGKKKC